MKFYLSCIQKLSEIVQETSGAENRFLACPSLRVYESNDFNFLTAQTPNSQDYLSSENVSMQFNSLSASEKYWDIDATNNLYDVYKEKLEELTLTARDTITRNTEAAEKLLHNQDGSPSQALQDYTVALNEYEEILDEHSDFLSNIDLDATPEEQLVTIRKWDVLQKQLSLFVAKWKLTDHKEEIEEALEKLNTLSAYDAFLVLKETIESRLREGETTGIKSLIEFSKVNIFPSDFHENDLSWSSLEITNKEVDAIFKRAQNALKGFNEDILNFDYDENFIEKITASYCIVTIKRPWLHKTIFESEFIAKGPSRKEYTFAKKIVLIKDIRVVLKEDLTPQEKAEIDGSSLIKFGPLFMKNQLFVNKTTTKQFIKPITSKKIYSKAYAPKMDIKLGRMAPELVMSKPVFKTQNQKTTKKKTTTSKAVKAIPHNKLQMLKIDPRFAALKQKKASKPKTKLKGITLSDKESLTRKTLDLKNIMIYNIPKPPKSKTSRTHFVVQDHLGSHPLYKVEISIKDQRSNYFKEVETAENGQVSIVLTPSNYEFTLRKNGFKEMTFLQTIKEDANVTILKQLEPKEVIFDSYFLVGVIGDQIQM